MQLSRLTTIFVLALALSSAGALAQSARSVPRGGHDSGCGPGLLRLRLIQSPWQPHSSRSLPCAATRTIKERVFVPGTWHAVHEPARYEWRFEGCRLVRVCVSPAQTRWVQSQGHYEWRTRVVPVCSPGC